MAPISVSLPQSIMPCRFFMKATLHKEKEQAYVDEHDNIYPEVSSGLRAAGVINLHIWKDGLQLYMLIEMEDGKDLSVFGEGSTYRQSSPRVVEWEDNSTAGGRKSRRSIRLIIGSSP